MTRHFILVVSTFLAQSYGAEDARHRRALEQLKKIAVVETNVMIPMRDGVRLATDIVRPKGEGRFPVVLTRTPYRKRTPLNAGGIRSGYAFAVQDVRGRYESEGEFYPFIREADDGYDTIEWLAAQSWCDGNIGMSGGSYVGLTQLAAAMAQPPHLRCIRPFVPPADFDGGTIFYGGALRMELAQGWLLGQSWRGQRVLRSEVPDAERKQWQPWRSFQKWCWHLPLKEPGPIVIGGPGYAQCWSDIVANWENPEYWIGISAALRPEKVQVPVLIGGGFYDIFAQENIQLLFSLRERGGTEAARRHSHLLMGPWVHGLGRPAGDVNYRAAHSELGGLDEAWYGRWLKGEKNGVDEWPAMRFFVMGLDRWVDTDAWPPKESKLRRLYFARGTLAETPPAADEPPSVFTYDPAKPVPTSGGTNLILPNGVQDHAANAQRPDVVAFVSDVLDEDVVVAGRARVHLFVSSSAPDTDFTAMVLDVRPDGYLANLQDGITRARYRNGRARPQLLKPGEIVELDIDLWSTAYVFKKGHRVAVHISSSNFPRFDRNLNTADTPGQGTQIQTADNKIYHDALRASYLEGSVY